MKTMAEVIREADEQWNRDVQVIYTDAAWAEYMAAALAAAGYGPVKEAQARALREAADHVAEIDGRPDDAARDWLRARAATIEAEP